MPKAWNSNIISGGGRAMMMGECRFSDKRVSVCTKNTIAICVLLDMSRFTHSVRKAMHYLS